MVIDVYDAVPVNPKEFHSHHVLLTNVTDRLLEELRTFPLEAVKGVFVENDLLQGTIFEQVHRGKSYPLKGAWLLFKGRGPIGLKKKVD